MYLVLLAKHYQLHTHCSTGPSFDKVQLIYTFLMFKDIMVFATHFVKSKC